METDEIIILAASQKHGGRCIAGISREDRRWIRPVSRSAHGELYPNHYGLGGDTPRLLDVVRFEHSGRTGEPGQPENVHVAPSPWERVDRIPATEAYEQLRPALISGPELLGSTSYYVDETVAAQGVDASLALIEPSNVIFTLERHTQTGAQTPRARFTLSGQAYDLPLTEFIIRPRLLQAGYGSYSLQDLAIEGRSRTLLVVSLGTPYDHRRFKLVAAVLPLP